MVRAIFQWTYARYFHHAPYLLSCAIILRAQLQSCARILLYAQSSALVRAYFCTRAMFCAARTYLCTCAKLCACALRATIRARADSDVGTILRLRATFPIGTKFCAAHIRYFLRQAKID